ncbi:hypothetical protein [Palaeococcus sp. (in: euryarchaeotes)]
MNFFDVHFERRNGHTVRIRGMLMIMPAKEDKTPHHCQPTIFILTSPKWT